MCGPFLLSYAASWARPASVSSGAGHMSGSAGRAPRPSLPGWGTSRASAASGMAWHGRQGTTGPGDALMVGIPAARLRF